jgi:hypothetical protein
MEAPGGHNPGKSRHSIHSRQLPSTRGPESEHKTLRETQCYEALGIFASLIKLGLHLDCSNAQELGFPGADADDFERQPYRQGLISQLYNADIRDALINSAIVGPTMPRRAAQDKPLAKQRISCSLTYEAHDPIKAQKTADTNGIRFGTQESGLIFVVSANNGTASPLAKLNMRTRTLILLTKRSRLYPYRISSADSQGSFYVEVSVPNLPALVLSILRYEDHGLI